MEEQNDKLEQNNLYALFFGWCEAGVLDLTKNGQDEECGDGLYFVDEKGLIKL